MRACDEPATAKHCFHVQMSRGGLSVAALPLKQVDVQGVLGGGSPEHDPEKWVPIFRKDHA
jgi:hypothetical protein